MDRALDSSEIDDWLSFAEWRPGYWIPAVCERDGGDFAISIACCVDCDHGAQCLESTIVHVGCANRILRP